MDYDIYDELNMRGDEEISKLIKFELTEKILYSGLLKKINSQDAIQERVILVTNNAIYNIIPKKSGLKYKFISMLSVLSKSFMVKRVIPLAKICAITISTHCSSCEFVIHVENDYDYRFDGHFLYNNGSIDDKREKFFMAVARGFSYNNNINLVIMLTDEVSLEKYTTQKKDFKAGISKIPSSLTKTIITPDDLVNGLKGLFALNRSNQKNGKGFDQQIPLTTSIFVSNQNIPKQHSRNKQVQSTQIHILVLGYHK